MAEAVPDDGAGRKRKAQRKRPRPGAGKGADADGGGRTAFFGQLAKDVSGDDLRQFLTGKGIGVEKVRLLHDKATSESRGIAFVDFASGDDLTSALRLHKAPFRGKFINVEYTAGGGGNNEVRGGCGALGQPER